MSASSIKRDKTVGAHSVELAKKDPDTRDPIELQREIHKDYEKNIFEAVDRGLKEIHGDFFVVVTTKKERLMQNVIRNYFNPRKTCPTPEYDQTVYHYIRKDDKLDFLWVVPAKDACEMFRINALGVSENERDLLYFVLSFYDGSLLRQAKKLNGEEIDSPLLERGHLWKIKNK